MEYNPFFNGVYKGPGAARPTHHIFGPVVQPGGTTLPFQPYVAFARGEISDVPFFFWNVQSESYRETFTAYTTPMDEATYRTVVTQTWGEANAPKIFSLYPFPNDKVYVWWCLVSGMNEVLTLQPKFHATALSVLDRLSVPPRRRKYRLLANLSDARICEARANGAQHPHHALSDVRGPPLLRGAQFGRC